MNTMWVYYTYILYPATDVFLYCSSAGGEKSEAGTGPRLAQGDTEQRPQLL